jgi:hypothetical protein
MKTSLTTLVVAIAVTVAHGRCWAEDQVLYPSLTTNYLTRKPILKPLPPTANHGYYLSLTTNQIQFWGPGGDYTNLPTYATQYAYSLASARTNITLPALGGLTWIDNEGYVSTTLYNSDPFGLECDSDFHVYGCIMACGDGVQFNRFMTDDPNRRNWSMVSEDLTPGDFTISVSLTNGHSYASIPVVQFQNDLSANFFGAVRLQNVSTFQHYVQWVLEGGFLSGYTGPGMELFPSENPDDFGIRAANRLLLSAGNRTTPDCILDDNGLSVPNLTVTGTDQQITFGSTSSPPANTAAPSKWISVHVSGDPTEYRLPLYQ